MAYAVTVYFETEQEAQAFSAHSASLGENVFVGDVIKED